MWSAFHESGEARSVLWNRPLCWVVTTEKRYVTNQIMAAEDEPGWRSDESARLLPMWPGFHSGLRVIRGLSLLLVLILAARVFSESSGFSSLLKN